METIIGAGDGGVAPAAGDMIKETDQTRFAQDVIEASMECPVIVDFWAPWCGPCKQLGPALEKVVQNARGAVKMVKVNIDENQELALQLRIQSIPTVFAFFRGQPVDAFQGARPESELKDFVKRLAQAAGQQIGPSPVDQALEQAAAFLEAGQLAQASTLYGQVLQHEPDNKAAIAGLLSCQISGGDVEGARETVDALEDEVRDSSELASALAQLKLAETAAEAGPIDELKSKVEANPGDHQARFDLAVALQAAGRNEEAAEELLDIVRRDRNWNDEAARKQLLTYFEAWGQTDPLTLDVRRRLSSLLFS